MQRVKVRKKLKTKFFLILCEQALDVLLNLSGLPPLDLVEREMIYFARHCEICHVTDKDLLTPCKKCYMVSYCCQEHQEQV